MEKISGVLGTSPRLKSTDLQSSSAIRPGMPTFGRPVGETAVAHRKDLTTAQKANMIREQMSADKKMMYEARAAERLADQFFMNKPEVQTLSPMSEQIVAEARAAQTQVVAAPEIEPVVAAPENLDPEERKFTPKGSYLDRSV